MSGGCSPALHGEVSAGRMLQWQGSRRVLCFTWKMGGKGSRQCTGGRPLMAAIKCSRPPVHVAWQRLTAVEVL